MCKLLCVVLSGMVMFGCLVTSADAADEVSAISEKYETTEAVITRATGNFDFTIKAKGLVLVDTSFTMSAGETVRIRASYSPENASMDFGLVDSEGVYHYINMSIGHYEYPIKPGTTEWEELGTFSRRIAACRIPEETLDAMTTDALVDAVLDFPFLMNLMVYNSASEGFDCLLSQCDALKELLTREDGADKLAEEYASLTTTLGSKSVIESKDTMSREALYPNLLEVILGQPEVYNEMTENNQYATEIAAKEFNDNKTSFLDVAIEENESQITRATTVKTPKGSTVEWIDYSGLPQMTADEKAYYNNWVQENYTIISVVRDPNVYYNCHSYAWYSTSSANKVWIPDPSIYMTDGSYTKKGSASATCKVFVKNDGTETSEIDGLILGDHSGIVNSVSGRTIVVTSKWGALGLYKHNVANSPYSGDHTTYTYWK